MKADQEQEQRHHLQPPKSCGQGSGKDPRSRKHLMLKVKREVGLFPEWFENPWSKSLNSPRGGLNLSSP